MKSWGANMNISFLRERLRITTPRSLRLCASARVFSYLSLFFILSSLLIGCADPLTPSQMRDGDGKGFVCITVDSDTLMSAAYAPAAGRTVFPVKNLSYTYTFTKEGMHPQNIPPYINGRTVGLDAGNWTVQVDAFIVRYDDVLDQTFWDLVAESDTMPFTVTWGETMYITIFLKPAGEVTAPGTFSFAVQYPAGVSASVTLKKLQAQQLTETVYDDTGEIDAEPLVFFDEMELAAGCYLLTIQLSMGGLHAGLSEVIYIYPGMTTIYGTEDDPVTFTSDILLYQTIDTTMEIQGITPKWGAQPTNGNITETEQYTGTIEWKNTYGLPFGIGTYTAEIELEPKDGYTFEGVAANSFSVTGAVSSTNGTNSGCITAVFNIPEPPYYWFLKEGGASGTAYYIGRADQLHELAMIVNDTTEGGPERFDFDGTTIILIDDIDLGVAPYNEGEGWVPIGVNSWGLDNFKGTFDGTKKIIRNLYINRPDSERQGLFGWVSGGKVRRLGLENVNITGKSALGGVAGVLSNAAEISHSYTTGTISGLYHVGGLAGSVNGTLSYSYSTAALSANNDPYSTQVGGLAGTINGTSSILNCAALNPSVGNGADAGRIVGFIEGGSVTLSSNISFAGMTGGNFGVIANSSSDKNGESKTIFELQQSFDYTITGVFPNAAAPDHLRPCVTHNYQWVVTTQAEINIIGEKKEICARCGNVNATAAIMPHTSVSDFAALQKAIADTLTDNTPTTITVTSSFDITALLTIDSGKNITITGESGVTAPQLTRGVTGNLFTVDGSLTLENIVIDGNKSSITDANGSLVYVNGGELTMNSGAVLQNNKGNAVMGGGVRVNEGTFTMNGGRISGNEVSASYNSHGGGVYAASIVTSL